MFSMTHKICIFGASGATGLALTQLAREDGHCVVAFVRSQPAKEKLPPGVTVVVGNLLNRNDVEQALARCEAIICAIGPRSSSPEVFCADSTQNIIEAMKAQGVRRLVCITGAMIGDYPHLSWFMRRMKNSYQKQQSALARDRAEQEQRVATSGLDWTLIKPPRLTGGPARGRVRSGENLSIGALSSISRLDLSRFILDGMETPGYIGKRVVVRY
jgi:putative NADH-flavin reductase